MVDSFLDVERLGPVLLTREQLKLGVQKLFLNLKKMEEKKYII
jgi:hypothetical protein